MAEIAIRRRGPDSLPDSRFLLFFLLALQTLLVLIGTVLLTGELTTVLSVEYVARTALFFAFVYAVLSLFRVERRYRQTMCAMLGVAIVIQLAFLPVAISAVALGIDIESESFLALSLVFELWSVFISASILARSLSQPLMVGLMLEILFVLTSLYVGQLLSPAAPPIVVEAA
jgi:hypothetical protein